MSNKFEGIFDAVGERQSEKEESGREEHRGRRAAGKRSNPDYEQISAYIRRDTHRAVKLELLKEGEDTQFSELVERLLVEWLEDRGDS